MNDLGTAGLGIRAKLNLGVGIVVLVSALAFGGAYALIERGAILGEKQEHLVHVASMARLSLEGRDLAGHLDEIVELSHRIKDIGGHPPPAGA